ncbi:MAG: preprotein translocase subunit YajC [Thermovirga sp.]|nr:preprotein translocase subunit YajC [Thermovirga sp.]
MLLPLGVFIVIFYFLIIRPQKKRQRKHEDMLASIRNGDMIVTAGGFYGTVRDVKDDSFIVEIADGVKARVLKGSIQMKKQDEHPAG